MLNKQMPKDFVPVLTTSPPRPRSLRHRSRRSGTRRAAHAGASSPDSRPLHRARRQSPLPVAGQECYIRFSGGVLIAYDRDQLAARRTEQGQLAQDFPRYYSGPTLVTRGKTISRPSCGKHRIGETVRWDGVCPRAQAPRDLHEMSPVQRATTAVKDDGAEMPDSVGLRVPSSCC